jgi:hypothetical protein
VPARDSSGEVRAPFDIKAQAGGARRAGLGAMVALEVIEWPIAALLAATHFIEHTARDGIVKQLTEGLEEGI